jgi:protein-glutamine gamma-glutamyltransferase
MIRIKNEPLDAEAIKKSRSFSETELEILDALLAGDTVFEYDSPEMLDFELKLRDELVNASRKLNKSRLDFEVFRKSKCNEEYWERTENGGFKLKSDVKPNEAINDIFVNGSKYATECATAIVIVTYKALLELYGEELFNKTFPVIHLMDWHDLDRNLWEIGVMDKEKLYLPGDRRYFANPDVDPETPYWQGENVIDLGKGLYYGHGIGTANTEDIIKELNKHRKKDADRSAYLMDSAARPNFKRLYSIRKSYEKNHII